MSQPQAIVIGSGFGGLAAAVRLGARGYRVTVCERGDRPGGRASVYEQDGFTFDSGPTIITAPFLLEELWQLCGRRMQEDVELRPLHPFYRLQFCDGTRFDYSGDADQMRSQVARLAPGDVPGFERFLKSSEEIYRVGFERLGHVPFDSWKDMLRVLPALLRLSGHRSVYQLVAKLVRDPRLRTLLSFHPLLVGGNPFDTTAVYALIAHLERRHGVHYCMGGTGRLVQGILRLLERQGATVRLDSEVRSIELDQRRAVGVRLASGERLPAQVVVSNADAAWTYSRLLPPGASRQWTARRLQRARYSMSLFVWYFGTRGQYPQVPHHTILFGPRYRSLLSDIFRRKVLPADFSLYLHRPTATDPALAPPGCDTFYVLSPVANLQGGIDWRTAAEPYRRAIEAHLESTLLPGLRERVITSRLLTPLDIRDRWLSVHGAGFGLQPLLRQSAYFRPHNCSEDIENLYLVGAGTHPGAGVPGVLSSARVLDRVVPHACAAH